MRGRVRTRPDRGGCYAGNIPLYCVVAEFIGVALFTFLGGGCDANSVSNGVPPANFPRSPRNSCRGTWCRKVRCSCGVRAVVRERPNEARPGAAGFPAWQRDSLPVWCSIEGGGVPQMQPTPSQLYVASAALVCVSLSSPRGFWLPSRSGLSGDACVLPIRPSPPHPPGASPSTREPRPTPDPPRQVLLPRRWATGCAWLCWCMRLRGSRGGT